MTVTQLEKWLTKAGIADWFGCSERWIELRMDEGLPCAMIAGRIKFKASECEAWMDARGLIERRNGDG